MSEDSTQKVQAAEQKLQQPKPKKIGIALAGGAVRGLAHIGVLKVFDEEGINVSYITGTSIGAVIGAAYASGMKATEIESFIYSTDFHKLLDFTIPKQGLLAGRKIEKIMNQLTREKKFEDLLIPLSVVATDLKKSEKVILNKGNVARAIRASIAMPPFFTPVLIEGHELVDGGIVDPVPVGLVKDMGADIVIAVDLSYDIKEEEAKTNEPEKSTFMHLFYERFMRTEYNLAREVFRRKKIKYLPKFIKKMIIYFFDWLIHPQKIIKWLAGREPPRIIMIMLEELILLTDQLMIERLKDPVVDIVIKPGFKSNIAVLDFDKAKEIIKMGEDAARKALPHIKKMLAESNIPSSGLPAS